MKHFKKAILLTFVFYSFTMFADDVKDFHSFAPTPPMGWNSWDCYGPSVK